MSHIDFIGIGAPKCGTIWVSTQLEVHRQIGFAPDKEVYYFADTRSDYSLGKQKGHPALAGMPFASFRESVRTTPGAELSISPYGTVTSTSFEQSPVSVSHTW